MENPPTSLVVEETVTASAPADYDNCENEVPPEGKSLLLDSPEVKSVEITAPKRQLTRFEIAEMENLKAFEGGLDMVFSKASKRSASTLSSENESSPPHKRLTRLERARLEVEEAFGKENFASLIEKTPKYTSRIEKEKRAVCTPPPPPRNITVTPKVTEVADEHHSAYHASAVRTFPNGFPQPTKRAAHRKSRREIAEEEALKAFGGADLSGVMAKASRKRARTDVGEKSSKNSAEDKTVEQDKDQEGQEEKGENSGEQEKNEEEKEEEKEANEEQKEEKKVEEEE
eukprot:GCRY01004552.1.p1 GENE.GCRY01004552.1~~GCRY01004552.1.p1  ORF type:complete len:287 (+),score=69.22 GCRY01004552.1:146-1006(+)